MRAESPPHMSIWLFLVWLGGGGGGCRRRGIAESLLPLCLLEYGTEEGKGAGKATFCVIGRTLSVIILALPVTEYVVYARFRPKCFI